MSKKILIVDHNNSNRQILRDILCPDYDVLEASDSMGALDALRKDFADIRAVVLDFVAPLTGGYELLAEMRGDTFLSRIPVICASGSERFSGEAELLSLGVNEFIFKPYNTALAKYRIDNAVRLSESMANFERLRISEERYRIAASAGGRVTARYDIKSGVYYTSEEPLSKFVSAPSLRNIPQVFIDNGVVAPDSIKEYLAFFSKMKSGEKSCGADISILVDDGVYRWFHCDATIIFDVDDLPSQAIIVYTDITEQREKEAIYTKWQQSLQQKPVEKYTLFHCNLSRDNSFESMQGELLKGHVRESTLPFDVQTAEYALRFVHPDDREQYVSVVNSDMLLANYYRSKTTETIEYREVLAEDTVRWLRLNIELVEYPNSSDVGAYMMYEDISESKFEELRAKELAEHDALTGILNRAAFAQRVEQIISKTKSSEHAFIMMDIDYFKRLNDTFGHAAGDQALIDITSSLRSLLRHGDLLGRLGGDEFVIFMKDIPYDAVIEKKARQICSLTRKSYSADIQISASIGISVYPRDGDSFESLYSSADSALYSVKESGKDAYAFFDRKVQRNRPALENVAAAVPIISGGKPLRRMLIVDDGNINRRFLANMFKGEYIVETANDGRVAMMRLKHYGASISIVLLDLLMPGMDGFAVLEEMQANMETRSIPVIVVSGQGEEDISLRAIKAGATDFITKPVEPTLIRMRVESAVSKAESERLRAQNSYLVLQSSEEAKYRTVLDSTGTVVIEYDWLNSVFTYDPSISEHIAGSYNNRRLWHILLSDMVADTADVKTMQELVHSIANDRTHEDGAMMVRLKTPSGEKQWFRMRIFKRADDYKLTNKMIITFVNINSEVLASEQLRFRAERDELTGLYNRSAFFEQAEKMIAEKPEGYYVLSSVDIDNFKVINDQYGTGKGDEVLKGLAEVLADCTAHTGICGRIAADNFVILYSHDLIVQDSNFQRGHINEIKARVALPITISIGRYIVIEKNLSVSAMFDRASIARESIKGRYDTHIAFYDEAMRSKLLRAQEIVYDMNSALQAGQFEAWFQPQYNHATGALIGAEALARWNHPTKGLVFPGEFVPVFEQNGFIYELDKFIWEAACRYLKRRLDAGQHPLPVSVNLSRYDLFRPEMPGLISRLIKKYDIPVDLLRLEITESAFSDSAKQVVDAVKELVNYGFTVEIDDFGSGYSSLNTLKDVPAQIVKLDMRFLEGSDNTDRGGNIIESVVRMVKWLGMSLIAEGVETTAQADYLKTIGCIYVQGYLYAKPMPEEEYAALEASSRRERKLITMRTDSGLNNNSLWTPDSMDTLIFNTYVGNACIFEYYKGKIELLRANDKYASMLGSSEIDTQALLRLDWVSYLDESSRLAVVDAIKQSIQSEEDVSGEHIFLDLPGCPPKVYLRSTMRVIAVAGNRCLVYCISENITAQREADAQLKLLTDSIPGGIASYIVSPGGMKIVYFNDGFCHMLGYTREEYETVSSGNVMSTVYKEDLPAILEQTQALIRDGAALNCDYRVKTRNGGCRWVNLRGTAGARHGDTVYVNTVLYDVTEQKLAVETAQIHEREFALAIAQSGKLIYRYSHETRSIEMPSDTAELFGMPERVTNVPASIIKKGIIAPESVEEYSAFYEALRRGDETGSMTIRRHIRGSRWRWYRARFSNVYDGGGKPVSALIVFEDVTDELEGGAPDDGKIRFMAAQ